MRRELLTSPTAEYIVSAAQARAQARIDDDGAEEASIVGYIQTARAMAEHHIGRPLGAQSWRLYMDALPYDADEPLALTDTVTAITLVEYRDPAGQWQTLAGSAYTLDATDDTQALLRLVDGQTWPQTDGEREAVRVTVTRGLEPVPAPVLQWMLLRIAAMYEYRAGVQVGQSMVSLPWQYADGLLDPYRNWRGRAP